MKIEKLDKWLDDKYGISYTELVKIKEYLSEENERLKNELENTLWDEASVRADILLEQQDYKSRIDKAVEYIKEHNMIVVNKEYIPDGISTAYDYELMNILNGRSDE